MRPYPDVDEFNDLTVEAKRSLDLDTVTRDLDETHTKLLEFLAKLPESAFYQEKEVLMVLEVAILDVKPGRAHEFEDAFTQAQAIISSMQGYVSHQLQKCLEKPNRYILLVNWQTLEDHMTGFRGSPEYPEWRRLLHHFYDPLPDVEHYEIVSGE